MACRPNGEHLEFALYLDGDNLGKMPDLFFGFLTDDELADMLNALLEGYPRD